MKISLVVCTASFVILVWILRRSGVSLGLPAAYLANLLLLHLPGAAGQVLDTENVIPGDTYTRIGAIFTMIGTMAFVAGVWLGTRRLEAPWPQPAARSLFWRYCLLGGGLLTVVAFMVRIPSIGAVLKSGGPIWMLGVMLGLVSAMQRGEKAKMLKWLGALAIYPVLILLMTGFMSYGATAVIIVLSSLIIVARSTVKLTAVYVVCLVAGLSIFLSYFAHRDEIRGAVWSGADTDVRIEASVNAIRDIELFDPKNPVHLEAFDQRLNQNYFAGLAATRINDGAVDYLYGRSLWEGFQALIPRALWADKPVEAGSPKIVSEMTGLTLAEGTSFGVGNVMEFHINFGIPGLIGGFLILGFALGRLDKLAAIADRKGVLGDAFLYFLPAVAIIQPNGSIVEIMSGAAAATAAAFGWRWSWNHWPKPTVRSQAFARQDPSPQAL